MSVLALDIGGTNIRSGIVDKTKIKNYRKNKIPSERNEIVKKLFEIIESYPKQKAICVSTAGFERNGKITHALNNDTNGLALTNTLKKKFKTKVYVENDGNCAGLAELHFGAGKGKKNFVLLTLGTGIGGAIIVGGKLCKGNGAGGEIGSMIIDKGKIFEHLASGNASVTIAREQFKIENVTSLELEEKANNGDEKALAVYREVGYYLGVGLANLSFILAPEMFIVGGGFSRVKHIFQPAKESLERFYDIRPIPPIIKAKFGDDAGLIGASLLIKV